MKMKEAEARTGLDRKNIRYYESEELLAPRRTEGNRYRDYSEDDIQRLLEIRFLRQLPSDGGISARDGGMGRGQLLCRHRGCGICGRCAGTVKEA